MMSTERGSKKRKTRSGCNGIELASAFHVLQKFRSTIITAATDSDDDDVGDTDIDEEPLAQLDELLQWMDSKMKTATKSHAFSSASLALVSDVQISAGRDLSLKDDLLERVAAAKLVGVDNFMSSKNLHKFLDMLLNLVAKPSEASSRTWVDAFLYRASAMLPPQKQMVLNVEYNVSPVTVPTVSGSEVLLIARSFLNKPGIRYLMQHIESVLGFFVVEAKDRLLKLDDHLPQVVLQLYAAAKKLKKSHIRGTLTNGYEWFFLVLTVNRDGKGASYRVSDRAYSAAPQENGLDMVIPELSPDMISGILASWIEHSSEGLLEDDWFV